MILHYLVYTFAHLKEYLHNNKKIMESNIFGLQCEFMDKWDELYKIHYEGKIKKERLNFFRLLNVELSNFYHKYIDHNIWNFQRAYFFAFWIGIFYIKNSDIILEIEKILNFSNIYTPFVKIIRMLNSKVKRVIIDSDSNESQIIFYKMNQFKQERVSFEMKINEIIKFYRKYKRRQIIKKYCTTISILRKKLPDDIVLNITKFLESNNDDIINYLQNKQAIDTILDQCGLNMNYLRFVLNIFFKNKQDVIKTIFEIIDIDDIYLVHTVPQ